MRKTFQVDKTYRYYQRTFIDTAKGLIRSNPSQWHLFTSPTGTGKSICILGLLSELENSICITPRIEIIAGMLEDLGYYTDDMTVDDIVSTGWKYGIITPIRFRNMLSKGELSYLPSCLIIDEAHHDLANTYADIAMYLNGVTKIGLTATGYRGTPEQTKRFQAQWNDTIYQLLSLQEAVEEGFCSFPTAELWPMVDDDLIDVSAGDFRVKSVESAIGSQFDSIKSKVTRMFDRSSRLYDRPTMITVPGGNAARELEKYLIGNALPALAITQDTKRKDRSTAFQACQNSIAILIQINVVSEGVNLPKLRRIIDLSPTMSPVKWVQQIGRITRPVEQGEPQPEYICCCRNLERHGYLMEGLFPSTKIKEAQEAFTDDEGIPKYSSRSGTRLLGLEGLGKFTRVPVFMLDGTVAFMYNLVHTEGFKRTEYIALVHPCHADVVYGVKESANDGTVMKWGKWRLIEQLPELKKCHSAKVYPLTPKQENRWKESAEHFGLNPHRTINTREFQILPFLRDTNLRFRH